MAEPSTVAVRLRELADLLRRSPHLGPEAQGRLADLMDELGGALDPAKLPDASQQHLTESATHLVNSLHKKADAGLLASAARRLEEAAIRVEAEAPLASGVLRRLIDALANLGV